MTSNEKELFYHIVGGNIRKYRGIRNYSLQMLGEKIGLTKKTIQRYENGEIKVDMDRLADIAEALDIEIPQLLEGVDHFLGIDTSARNQKLIPIVGKISCGNGSLAFEDIEGYEPLPRDFTSGGQHIYLRAKGESMINARIHNGDLLLIRIQPEVENGEIAAVKVGDEILLKRFYDHGKIIALKSENPLYPQIEVPKDEVKVIGKLKMINIKI